MSVFPAVPTANSKPLQSTRSVFSYHALSVFYLYLQQWLVRHYAVFVSDLYYLISGLIERHDALVANDGNHGLGTFTGTLAGRSRAWRGHLLLQQVDPLI